MAWPCRARAVGRPLDAAQARRTPRSPTPIAAFEPVTMVVPAGADAAEARRRCWRGEVEVVELPIDDSWMRDSGPIFVVDAGGRARAACTSASTPGARSSRPTTTTRAVGRLLAEHLGDPPLRRRRSCSRAARSPSTARARCVTTEQCLLQPEPQPRRCRRERDRAAACATTSASRRSCGSGTGLVEDHDTDGHVDNDRRVRRARARCCCRAARPTPTRTTSAWPTTASAVRDAAAAIEVDRRSRRCPTPRSRRGGRGSVPEPLPLQRRAWSCRSRATEPTSDALELHRGGATPTARSSPCPAPCSPHGGGGAALHHPAGPGVGARPSDGARADHRRRHAAGLAARASSRRPRAAARRPRAAALAPRPRRAPRPRSRDGRRASPPARARSSSACRS